MRSSPVKILKFGGSSVGSVESLRRVVSIIKGEADACRPIVVVSALSGVTDLLESLVTEKYTEPIISQLAERHIRMAEDLLVPRWRFGYMRAINATIDVLRYVIAQPGMENRTERITATGELLSAPLVSACLQQEGVVSQSVDARTIIVAHDGEVDRSETAERAGNWFSTLSRFVLPVVTGFIAGNVEGKTTLLGRGGSDYTAALLAEAIGADKLDRWTDVDGLYTADPNREKRAGKFLFLLLEDASTWNEASALGMHEEVFKPVLQACIPVHVRSTRFPQGDGTLIIPSQLPGKVEATARKQLAHASHQVSFGPKLDRKPLN